MPVAIDTSVLVAAEKGGGVQSLLPPDDPGPYYIPAHAAAEFLVGTHPPVRDDLRQRAAQLYTREFRAMVAPFTEADAAQHATLIAELRSQGQMMKFFDTCIAAGALARGDTAYAP